jgi:hypothetical protein
VAPTDASAVIGSQTMGDIAATGRQSLTFPWPGAAKGTVVCVAVQGPGFPEIGWNVYPPDTVTGLRIP